MMNKIGQFRKKYMLAITTGIGVFVLGLLIMWALLARSYGIVRFKEEFSKMIAALNQAGYDIAYDNIHFTPVSPFKIMEIQNLRIYSPGDGAYKEWLIPSLSVNANLLDYRKLTFDLAEQQSFTVGGRQYQAHCENSDVVLNFDDEGLYSLLFFVKQFTIQDFAEIKSIRIAMQRNETDGNFVMENFWDVRNVRLLTENTWNMSEEISELYINFDLKNRFVGGGSYLAAFDAWQKNGGQIDVNKLIVDWKPLVMVARGAVEFDKGRMPRLRLISTSKELVPTLDNLEKAQIIDSKSSFVAKIILAKKSQPVVEGEDYYTIITPLEITPSQVMIEGISLLPQPKAQAGAT